MTPSGSLSESVQFVNDRISNAETSNASKSKKGRPLQTPPHERLPFGPQPGREKLLEPLFQEATRVSN